MGPPVEQYRSEFIHEFRSSSEALADARHRFGEWLSSQAIALDDRDDLTVAMSELGANAVNAAAVGGQAHVAITIRAWRSNTGVTLEVENAAQTQVEGVVFHGDDDPLRGSGRGLMIVTAYTDTVEVIPPGRGHGLTVRCTKHCSSSTPA